MPRKNRLLKFKDFQRVMSQRKTFSTSNLVFFYERTDLQEAKVGFIVSRKVSTKSVIRNKIKRWLREAVRLILPALANFDYVVLVKPGGIEDQFSFALLKKQVSIFLSWKIKKL